MAAVFVTVPGHEHRRFLHFDCLGVAGCAASTGAGFESWISFFAQANQWSAHAYQAILGYKVLFKNAATLSTELCEAKDHYSLGKLERNLEKVDLLILDELSYLSFNRHQSELLFKVISDRSEKSSTIVTTNLPFSRGTELFENTTMVAALVDRLTFRSHVLDMNGESYRLKSTAP